MDQQQVRLNVAFTITRPVAGKVMIAVARIQRLIGRQSEVFAMSLNICVATYSQQLLKVLL